jgi:hypothetical protein
MSEAEDTGPIQIRDVEVLANPAAFFTIGLYKYIGKELIVAKAQLGFPAIKPILTYIIEFIQDNKLQVKHGEKLSCFTWMISLNENGSYFEVYEYFPERSAFVPGLKFTHDLYARQKFVCGQINIPPNFPLCDQIVTIDPLIKTGKDAHLFRWRKQDPDSGWIVLTDNFEGQESRFEQITVGQFITMRPESSQFLALPSGFKVIKSGNDAKIGFDKNMDVDDRLKN